MKVSKFFNSRQKKEIVFAIQEAETKISGEIKVHVENICN